MKIRQPILRAVVVALLFPAFAAVNPAQQPNPPDPPTLSASLRAALYPEVMCVYCVIPQWDHGYILHREFDKDPALATMYDRNGKKVLEARIQPLDFGKISLRALAATQSRGILAVGGGIMTDGSIQGFTAKTDPTGRTVQSLHTGVFSPHQVCEATDGTVWILGSNVDSQDSSGTSKNVLRHYSFEKGLLGGLIPLDSISKSPDAILEIESPQSSFLRCNKDRVSVLFSIADLYIAVDPSNEKVTRWKVALPPLAGRKTTGFAVTEEGRIFLSVSGFSEPDDQATHGLYEMKAQAGNPIATVISVDGTFTAHDRKTAPSDDAFGRLLGADGDELVVHRHNDGWGISWARVLPSSSTPD